MRPVPVIDHILSTPALWRGRQVNSEGHRVVRSGWPMLDALLPGGGWPLGSLIEVGIPAPGSGECALFLPLWVDPPARIDATSKPASPGAGTSRAPSRRTKPLPAAATQKLVTLIDPPFLPYAPGWQQRGVALSRLWWVRAQSERQRLWAAEQSLRSGICAAVMLWPQDIEGNALRRLQLAAESSDALGLCFRPEAELAHASHAPIRLHLRPGAACWDIELIKCRGRTGGARLRIPHPSSSPPPLPAATRAQESA